MGFSSRQPAVPGKHPFMGPISYVLAALEGQTRVRNSYLLQVAQRKGRRVGLPTRQNQFGILGLLLTDGATCTGDSPSLVQLHPLQSRSESLPPGPWKDGLKEGPGRRWCSAGPGAGPAPFPSGTHSIAGSWIPAFNGTLCNH